MKERKIAILEMREAGRSFRQIGAKLGISTGRARALHRDATLQRNRYCSLSVRASNVLYHWGLWPEGAKAPDKAEIKAFIEREGVDVYKKQSGVGPVLVKEICDWAGIEAPLIDKKICPCCGQVIRELAYSPRPSLSP